MNGFRRKLYSFCLEHLENRVKTDMERQEEARRLLTNLLKEDISQDNSYHLVRCANLVLRSDYVSLADLEEEKKR